MLGSDRFTFETPNVIDPGDAAPSAPPRRESYQQARNSPDRLLSDINDLELDPHGPSEETQSFLADSHDMDGSQQNNYSHQASSPASLTNTEKLYFDDPDSGDYYKESSGCAEHSLPSVEEARTYAVSLLHTADRADGSSSMDPFARAVQLAGPSQDHDGEPRRSRLANFGRKKRNHGASGSFDSNINDLNISIDSARSASSKHLVRNQLLAFLGKILLVVMLLILFGLMISLITRLTQERRSESSSTEPQIPSTTVSRLEKTYAFLHTQLLTDPSDLLTEGSPHFLAANWIADMDVLEKEIPASIEDASAKAFLQRYVLVLLYYATSGPNKWRNKASFLSEQLECGWYDNQQKIAGFGAGQKYSMGVTCNGDLEVVNLLLPTNALSGSIPEEIGYLTSLTLLALPHNELEGNLPSALSMMSNLQYLDVKFNFLKGKIPDVFDSVNQLRILGLSNNYLEEALPSSMASLNQLKTLAIDDNLLNGDLDPLQSMSSLEFLYADRNSFVDVVDDSFLADMPGLREVDLSGNELTINNIFPAHLLQHPSLQIADFANNRFQGALPGTLNANQNLEFLSFRDNEFSGVIGAGSLPQLIELKHLDIQGNSFEGELPPMTQLSKLSFLFMGNNPMLDEGPIPSWLFELKEIRELGMSNMRLNSDVPYWLETMDKLTFLDLSHNRLQGQVPRSVLDLPNLAYILLHNNTLSGAMPTQIVGADKLQMMTLYDNSFTGDMNHLCEEAPDIQLLAVDCNTPCDEECCPSCCDRSKEDLYTTPAGINAFCFGQAVPTYLQFFEGLWELNYTRAQTSFDPSLLTDDPDDPVHGD